jgi:ABC-2 type transport system ATP-binding protein
VILVISGVVLWSAAPAPTPAPLRAREALLDVLDGPGGGDRVQIDVTLYSPAETPAPAIVLTHGFGESKDSVTGQAHELARRGFTVLTYSSRGFGRSTGQVALNSPDFEVADAHQIIDWLARQPEVMRDSDLDPRLGVTGASYGGALSLLLAGTDPRVDAVAPTMTYNDLSQGLLPNNATTRPIPAATAGQGVSEPSGVFKQAWAGLLFSSGAGNATPHNDAPEPRVPRSNTSSTAPSEPPVPSEDSPNAPQTAHSTTCGNFAADVCAAYTEVARTGRAGEATLALLEKASPKSVTGNVKVPTLLVQGERDTLFGLDQADANARQIAAAGAKVKVIWFAGGHDGGAPGPQLRSRIADWFAFHLGGVPPVPDPGTGFEFDIPAAPRRNGSVPVRTVVAPAYPGVNAERTPRFSLALRGAPAEVVNPPGGRPASTSSLPGNTAALDAARSLGESVAHDVIGQVATFSTEPVSRQLLVSGVPQTRLSVSSVPGEPAAGDAVLFPKLYDVGADGRRTLMGNAVAPVHVTNLPPDGSPVEVNVALPGVVHSLEPGHHVELAVATTDQAYATPTEPAVHRIALAGQRALTVPSVNGSAASGSPVPVAALTGLGAIGMIALAGWVIAAMARRRPRNHDPDLEDTPLVVSKLSKRYGGDITAVHGLSIRVDRGQVVGLLGPNGAGKTTTLRTVLGLLHPTSGEVRIFGHRLYPGAPVLSRVGCFVQDPGFLPHLSGVDNLRSFWSATGRPMLQARFDEALQIAGLGENAHRKVSTYSRGVKQRLAIAQAMLGLPDLLLLDEPTNGLDPPQIRQLREVLRRYAATGRAVVMSSHLLSEVEQTCTHVMVMHDGQLVASGSVSDLVEGGGEATFRVDDPERAASALRSLEGFGRVEVEGALVHAELGGHTTAIAVNALVASGVSVHQAGPRRRLEDAFLQLVGEEQR